MTCARLCCEGARDQQNLRSTQCQSSVELREPQIIGDRQSQVTNWREAWLNPVVTLPLILELLDIDASRFLKFCRVKMHLPVLGVDVPFSINDEVSLIVDVSAPHKLVIAFISR